MSNGKFQSIIYNSMFRVPSRSVQKEELNNFSMSPTNDLLKKNLTHMRVDYIISILSTLIYYSSTQTAVTK